MDRKYSAGMKCLKEFLRFSIRHRPNQQYQHRYIRDCTRDVVYVGLVLYNGVMCEYTPSDHAKYTEKSLELLLFYTV